MSAIPVPSPKIKPHQLSGFLAPSEGSKSSLHPENQSLPPRGQLLLIQVSAQTYLPGGCPDRSPFFSSLALACLSCLYQITFDVSCYLNYQLQRGLDLPIHHCTQHLRQWLPHSRCSLKTCYVSRADALAVGMSLGLAFKTRTQSY